MISAVVFILIGLIFIIFNRPLARFSAKLQKNSVRLNEKLFSTQYYIGGIGFIALGLISYFT